MEHPVKVLIVDDHWIVRKGLKSILESDPRFEIVGEAGNGKEALTQIRENRPDVVLLDIRLPDVSGVEVCQAVKDEGLGASIVILTAFLDWRLIQNCIQAGAKGYLLKDTNQLNLKEKLLAVSRGESVVDPRVVNLLVKHVHNGHCPTEDMSLSPREMEILRLMSQGLSNREIGEKLFLSQSSVKHYVSNIMYKLNARNRVEAIMIATRAGLL